MTSRSVETELAVICQELETLHDKIDALAAQLDVFTNPSNGLCYTIRENQERISSLQKMFNYAASLTIAGFAAGISKMLRVW